MDVFMHGPHNWLGGRDGPPRESCQASYQGSGARIPASNHVCVAEKSRGHPWLELRLWGYGLLRSRQGTPHLLRSRQGPLHPSAAAARHDREPATSLSNGTPRNLAHRRLTHDHHARGHERMVPHSQLGDATSRSKRVFVSVRRVIIAADGAAA